MGIRNPLQSILPDIGLQQSGVGIRPIGPAGQRQLGGVERLPGGLGGFQPNQLGMFDTSQEDIDDLNRNLAIKEAVRETVKSGKMSDGRGGINIKEIAIALAPLLATGVGALVGGKKGAEAGAAFGTGFAKGSLLGQQSKEQLRIKEEELEIRKTLALGRMSRDQAQTELVALQKQSLQNELNARPSQDLVDFTARVADVDDPTLLREAINLYSDAAKTDPRLQRAIDYTKTLADVLGTAVDKVPSEFMQQWVQPAIKEVDEGNKTPERALRDLIFIANNIPNGERWLPSLTSIFVAQKVKNTHLNLSKMSPTDRSDMSNWSLFAEQSQQIINLVNAPGMDKLLGRWTDLGMTIREGLEGEVPDALRETRNRLALLVEFYGRDQSGAAIGVKEDSKFMQQTGSLKLTQRELIKRLSDFKNVNIERITSLVRRTKTGTLGFNEFSRERKERIINGIVHELIPDLAASQIIDPENMTHKDRMDHLRKLPKYKSIFHITDEDDWFRAAEEINRSEALVQKTTDRGPIPEPKREDVTVTPGQVNPEVLALSEYMQRGWQPGDERNPTVQEALAYQPPTFESQMSKTREQVAANTQTILNEAFKLTEGRVPSYMHIEEVARRMQLPVNHMSVVRARQELNKFYGRK